jgi:hypothetical protein
MSKCLIIKMIMLMWTHQSLDMNEEDRKNAMNQTELIYDYSIQNKFDPFAIYSIVYHESRFRNLQDLNTVSCGAFQVAHAYVPKTCDELKTFRVSLEVAFDHHILNYMQKFKYKFEEKNVLEKDYKSKQSLIEIFRLYASGPNCNDPKEDCYKDSQEKAKNRLTTRNRLHKIFLDNYKNYANAFHLIDGEKCTK